MNKNVIINAHNVDREVAKLVAGKPVRVLDTLGMDGEYQVKAAGNIRVRLDAAGRATWAAQAKAVITQAAAEGRAVLLDDAPQSVVVRGAVLTDVGGTDHIVGASPSQHFAMTIGGTTPAPEARVWAGYETI